jgi:hypothetical protein
MAVVTLGPMIAVLASLAIPPPVTAEISSLKPVDRFGSLPAAIRAGRFTVDGSSAIGWQMAEPGAAFSATDVPVRNAPGRRLIFAACDSRLCLVHYERGGVAHFYEILALSLTGHDWKAIWNVVGSKPFANFAALRVSLQRQTLGPGWKQQWVKGDF